MAGQGNWLQHALRRSGWRPQRQVAALLGVTVFVAIIMGGVYLSQVASFATTSRQLEALIAQRNELERTNEQLRVEIAGYRTVSRLLARAQELGFVDASSGSIEYLSIDGYNPNRAQTEAPIEQVEQVAAPVYDDSFSGWLQQQFDSLRRQFEAFNQGG
jgi:hypothetical protein